MSRSSSETASLVLTGGRVHTFDAADTVAEAIAIDGDHVVRVGTADDVRPLIGGETRVFELNGGAVLPGVNDSHLHAGWLGARWPHLIMDSLAGGQPPVDVPRLDTKADRQAAITRAQEVVGRLGITSYTEPGLGPGEDAGPTGCFGSALLDDYAELAAQGVLTARVTALLLFGELDGPSTLSDLRDGLATFRPPADVDRWFRVAGVKIFADGVAPMRTAWMQEPYLDGGHGHLLVEGADDDERAANLATMIRLAHAAGHQVGVHATGSRTTRSVVHDFVTAISGDGRRHRHYVIHGDLVDDATLNTMADFDLALNTQPGLAVSVGGMLAAAVGAPIAEGAWPSGAALRAGVRLALSSDSPILTPDWRIGVAAAVTRRGLDGKVHGAAQRIAVREALRGYTTVPAWLDHAESWKGTLAPGMIADLCVLEADPFSVEPAALPDVPIKMTVVGGRVVYEP